MFFKTILVLVVILAVGNCQQSIPIPNTYDGLTVFGTPDSTFMLEAYIDLMVHKLIIFNFIFIFIFIKVKFFLFIFISSAQ